GSSFTQKFTVNIVDDVVELAAAEPSTSGVYGENLLVNGSFETTGGWTASDIFERRLEEGIPGTDDGFPDVAAEGSYVAELDNRSLVDFLYQDILTEAGKTYELSFASKLRDNATDPATNTFDVFWNGELLQTIVPTDTENWTYTTFTVTGTGGEDRLEFRETAVGNDEFGGRIDDVQLREILSNSVTTEGTNGQLEASVSLTTSAPIQYTWTQTGGPAVTLSGADSKRPTFTFTRDSLETSNLLTNGSFESFDTGWTFTGNTGFVNEPTRSTDGTRHVAFNGAQSTPNGTLEQAFSTEVGQAYLVVLDFGSYGGGLGEQRLLVEAVGSSTLLSQTVFHEAETAAAEFNRFVLEFTADSASTTLRFTDTSATSTNVDGLLDYVAVIESEVEFQVTATDGTNSAVEKVTAEIALDESVFGTSASDTRFAGSNADGNSLMVGRQGDDLLQGGDGEDTIIVGSGADDIFAGNDDDTVLGGSGNDRLRGGDGSDVVFGGAGDDFVEGDWNAGGNGDGNDVLSGDGSTSIVIANETFEDGATGWSNNSTDNTVAPFSQYLGAFGTGQTTSKTFTWDTQNHREYALVEFDFYRIDTWDLNETATINLNGVAVDFYTQLSGSNTTGTTQSGTTSGINWSTVVASTFSGEGYNGGLDQRLKVRLEVPIEDADNLTVALSSSINGTHISDESFGIDNLRITMTDDPGTQIAAGDDLILGEGGDDVIYGDAPQQMTVYDYIAPNASFTYATGANFNSGSAHTSNVDSSEVSGLVLHLYNGDNVISRQETIGFSFTDENGNRVIVEQGKVEFSTSSGQTAPRRLA
ncbi:MAG: hypothetical protein AAF742_06945, partial [Pseudomonadota bacterium]